jgi:hypothetical protein
MNFLEYLTYFKETVDKNVEGWFYPIDIVMMYGVLNHLQKDKQGCLCEIGVAHGKSAIMISMFRNGEKFYLYDIFSEEARVKAEQNIYNYGNARDLIWKLQDTTNLKYDDLDYEDIKLLHIDGCHEHPAVLSDLILFSNKMADGGIIVVDDYNDYEYPGVNAGTVEFMLSKSNYKNWRVFAVGDNKAYLCERKYHKQYQLQLVDYIEHAKSNYNVPLKIRYGIRQVCDVNVLLCDSRMDWSKETVIENLFNKPIIG